MYWMPSQQGESVKLSRSRPHNFTAAQKAEIFRRDRATCAYSGRRLWILDFGACPTFPIDWADHVTAVANGGQSSLENGVCAHWYHNRNKGAKTDTPPFLFRHGVPTEHYFALDQQPRRGLADAEHLSRFARLDVSDWYFNRSLFLLLLGTAYLHQYVGIRKRDDSYYARAALKMIGKWRRLVARSGVSSLEDRGLVPTELGRDQKIMLGIRDMRDLQQAVSAMKELLPIYAERSRVSR